MEKSIAAADFVSRCESIEFGLTANIVVRFQTQLRAASKRRTFGKSGRPQRSDFPITMRNRSNDGFQRRSLSAVPSLAVRAFEWRNGLKLRCGVHQATAAQAMDGREVLLVSVWCLL